MGTIVEKIFTNKIGAPTKAGDIVMVDVDACMMQDINGPSVVKSFNDFAETVKSPDKHLFALDHFSPCSTIKAANNHQIMRKFVKKHKISSLIEEGQGICHQCMVDSGKVKPGKIVVGTDSHCCHYGVLNAFSTGIGAAEAAIILATDRCWFKVPETIRVRFNGKPRCNVTAKDMALVMIRELTQAGATYQCLEFEGEALQYLTIDGRAVICNMGIEAGSKGAIMPCDDILVEWLKKHNINDYIPVASDADAVYSRTVEIDVSAIEPMVAVPPDIDHVVPARELSDQKVNQVVIGGCTNGRFEDFKLAGEILQGKAIHPNIRLIIAPASRKIAERMLDEGVYDILLKAGGNILPPGCGPCTGLHGGLIGDYEVVFATANRNMPGRMGSNKGKVFIGSPMVAAYTALKGKISAGGDCD